MDWLPYGSADASVIFQHPLTSDPTGYLNATLLGTGHTFDPALGFCPNGTGYLRWTAMPGYLNLDYAGQMTFQVTREWLCEQNATNFSFGDVPGANQLALSAQANTGGSQPVFQKQTTGGAFAGLSGAFPGGPISSAGKSAYVTVNIGWNGGRVGGKVWMAIDGVAVASATRNSSTLVGLFENFYVGSDRGVAGSFLPAGRYIRNLQISTKAPFYAFHPMLAGIGILSDSTANTDDVVNGSYRDTVMSWSMRRRIEQRRGLSCGPVTIQVLGGHRLDDSIQTVATGLLAVTANNTFTRSDGGSFVADGFVIGSTLKASGFTNANNNLPYTISNVTISTIVITTTSLTVEGTGGSKQIIGAYMRNWLPTILAAKPSVVIIPGATNDAVGGRCTQANWQSKVTDYINDCMASDSVKLVVFAGPMTMQYGYAAGTYTLAAQIAAANTKIQAAIAAWRGANPTDPRQIVFADRYNALGAENPPPGTFIGQVDGLNDNLHCSGGGHVLQGNCVGDQIIGVLQ